MYCSKCGAQIPDDSAFCGSCGTPVSGQVVKGHGPQTLDMLSQRIKTDPAGTLIVLGSLLAIIGAFLRWLSVGVGGFTATTLGVNMSQGAVVLMGGVLCLAVLVLARSSAAGKWSVVMLLLSAVLLALVFQAMYHIKHNHASIGAGLWVAMVGALGITAGSAVEQCCPPKK
jgi:uncharacterized PurR-regulated membrane protein YhhQ (DUF165 family)